MSRSNETKASDWEKVGRQQVCAGRPAAGCCIVFKGSDGDGDGDDVVKLRLPSARLASRFEQVEASRD